MQAEQTKPEATMAFDPRLQRLLARVRHRQLEHALAGRVVESQSYASRAFRLRQVMGDDTWRLDEAAAD